MEPDSRPNLLRQMAGLLSRRERRIAAGLLVIMVAQAGFELVGIASVLPFMSVAADPGIIHRNAWLARAYEWGGFTTDTGFLTALGLAVIAALALSNGVSAFTSWAALRFEWGGYSCGSDAITMSNALCFPTQVMPHLGANDGTAPIR